MSGAKPIRVYDLIDCVVGAKRIEFERTRVGMNQALGDATKVFERVATWCAKEGILADLTRAHWFIDYDVNNMTDRVVVRAPLQGVRGPAGPPVGATFKGTFNEQMKAMIVHG